MEAPCKKLSSASSSSTSSPITNLPSNILMEILRRLPAKTLVASKCVCKSWLHLISDPEFTKLHQATAPIELCFWRGDDDRTIKLYMGNFNVLNSSQSLDLKIHTIFQLAKLKVNSFNTLTFDPGSINVLLYENYCNGLICLSSLIGRLAVVWNPITSEVAIFPSLGLQCGYGLGFSRKVNRFKLFRAVDRQGSLLSDRVIVAEVCTIEKGCSWKALSLSPLPYSVQNSLTWDLRRCSPFLQGALHWVHEDSKSLEITIFSFDFEDDRFGKIPPPPQLHKVQKHLKSSNEVGVLDGCLFITENTNEGFNLWLMKEYGVQDSWTKILSLEFSRTTFWSTRCLPIAYVESGEILLNSAGINSSKGTSLFLCNPVLNSIRVIGSSDASTVIAFRPSLVQLKDSLMGYDVHCKPRYPVSRREEITKTRSWSKCTMRDRKFFRFEAQLTSDEFCIVVEGEERNGHVCPVSTLSTLESSSAVSEPRQGTNDLTIGGEGESHGHSISRTGLVQTPTPIISAPETSKVELAHQEGSKTPLTNDETCVSLIREESHGCNIGMESVQDPSYVSSVPGTLSPESTLKQGSEVHLANDEIDAPVTREEREGCFSGMGLVKTRASCSRMHATMEDPLERIKTMEEVLEELRKERQQRQELEERLKNELAKVEPLKEQIQQNAQLKQQNQQLEERLRIEQAKVEQLKQQMQQSEQLKLQDRQLVLQTMDELRARLMGSQ